MMRIPIVSIAAATLLLATACSKPSQRSAEQAQAEADQKKIEAEQQQASERAAANARAEAERAQLRADRERAEAERVFATEKAEYAANIQREVDRNQNRLQAVESARAKAGGTARATYDRAVSRVEEARKNLDDDARNIQGATQSEWPGLKAKIDRDLDVYRSAVSDAEDARSKAEPAGGAAGAAGAAGAGGVAGGAGRAMPGSSVRARDGGAGDAGAR